tara:strand:- start:365 stop:601 length:237 start_codon:yes stop_codon:yes gene_type:complete
MKIQETYKDGQKYQSKAGIIVAVEYRRETSEAEQAVTGIGPIDITFGFYNVRKDGVTPDKRRKEVAPPHNSYLKYELI